jgi:hypothetical protein
MSGNIVIGHIGKEIFSALAGGGERWNWRLFVDHDAIPTGFVRGDTTSSLEEAKQQLELSWYQWIAMAGLWEG